MKTKMFLTTLALTGMMVSAAHADTISTQHAYAAPIDVTLGYQNNKVIDEDGMRLDIGTQYKDLRLGLSSFSTQDNFVEAYGVYAAMPIQIHETRVSIVPRIGVDRYRKEHETLGYLGLGAEYQLTPTVRADAIYTYSKAFDNDSDLKGDGYMVGLTKSF